MNPDILVIGESLIDIVRRPGHEPVYYPGGSPLNVAVGLGRLGHRPQLATWFGADDLGQLIAAHCAESNVDLTPGSDQARRTSTADAHINADGHADYVFDIDWQMPPITDCHPVLVHTGSIGALVEPGATQVLDFVESSGAFVTFDPNCRPSIMGDADTVRTKVERYVAASDLVKISDEDLAWLYPEIQTELEALDQLRHWLGTGPLVVVLTQGSRGAMALTEATEVHIPADTSFGLVDTVGAGDSFMAGLIHGLLSQGHPSDGYLTEQEIVTQILTQSARISGITVSRAGANPPWSFEIQNDLIA